MSLQDLYWVQDFLNKSISLDSEFKCMNVEKLCGKLYAVSFFHVSLALHTYQDSSVGKVSDSGVVGCWFLRTSLLC